MELRIVGTTDEPTPVPAPIEPEVTFDDAWLLYPRHAARKDAIRAFDKVPKPQRVEMMVAMAAWRRVWLDRGEMEYVPHFSTWVNGERWTDELPPGYALMPRVNGKASTAAIVQPEGERVPMPEHVKVLLAKLKEGHK